MNIKTKTNNTIEDVRFVYQSFNKTDPETMVKAVTMNFQEWDIGKVRKSAKPLEDTINLNYGYNFDESVDTIDSKEILDNVISPTGFNTPTRYYVLQTGGVFEITNIFINRTKTASRRGISNKYCVGANQVSGNTIPLFTITTDNICEADFNLINFEIERFLNNENIRIIDEADAKWLFRIALDYVCKLRANDIDWED